MLTTGVMEIMVYPRIRPAVSKPLCTAVPPVAYGGALAARIAARNDILQMMQALTQRHGACKQATRPKEIIFGSRGAVPSLPPLYGEGNRFPRASAAPRARLLSQPRPLPGANARITGLIDSLAFGLGCYSHTPPV